jgi:hypothetical protein
LTNLFRSLGKDVTTSGLAERMQKNF